MYTSDQNLKKISYISYCTYYVRRPDAIARSTCLPPFRNDVKLEVGRYSGKRPVVLHVQRARNSNKSLTSPKNLLKL